MKVVLRDCDYILREKFKLMFLIPYCDLLVDTIEVDRPSIDVTWLNKNSSLKLYFVYQAKTVTCGIVVPYQTVCQLCCMMLGAAVLFLDGLGSGGWSTEYPGLTRRIA